MQIQIVNIMRSMHREDSQFTVQGRIPTYFSFIIIDVDKKEPLPLMDKPHTTLGCSSNIFHPVIAIYCELCLARGKRFHERFVCIKKKSKKVGVLIKWKTSTSQEVLAPDQFLWTHAGLRLLHDEITAFIMILYHPFGIYWEKFSVLRAVCQYHHPFLFSRSLLKLQAIFS